MPVVNDVKHRTVIAQFSLRYAQRHALSQSLMLDETSRDPFLEKQAIVTDRIWYASLLK